MFICTFNVINKRKDFNNNFVPICSSGYIILGIFQMSRHFAIYAGAVFFPHIAALFIQTVRIYNLKKITH